LNAVRSKNSSSERNTCQSIPPKAGFDLALHCDLIDGPLQLDQVLKLLKLGLEPDNDEDVLRGVDLLTDEISSVPPTPWRE
jgi:hypothetical protein